MRLIFLFVFFSIIISNVNADIVTFKEEYKIGETFQAEINFPKLLEPIKIENVQILNKDNLQSNIGLKLNNIEKNRYFVYFNIPNVDPGEYKLLIKNVKYINNNILKKENFEKTFVIKEDKENIISIDPAYIIFKSKEKNFFKINIKNNGLNIINIKIEDKSNSTNIKFNNITLNKGSTESFYFYIINITKETINISINDINLPIYLLNDNDENIKFFIGKNENKLYLDEYNFDLPIGNNAEGSIFIENLGLNITNISLNIEGNIKEIIKLGFDKIEFLESKSTKEIGLFIIKNDQEGLFKGNLVLKTEDLILNLPIKIKISEFNSEIKNELNQNEKELETNLSFKKDENITIKTKEINKKTLSYSLIILIIIVFIIIYTILFIRSGKNNKRIY